MTTQEKLIAIYEAAEKRLKEIISQKISRGSTASYQRSLLKQVQKELKRLKKKSAAVVNELVKESYTDSLSELVTELKKAGVPIEETGAKNIEPEQLAMSGLNKSQIAVVAENINYDFIRTINLVGRRIEDNIREAAVEATAEKLSTGQTVRQMQKNLEQKLSEQDITAVEYRNGAKMPLKSYVAMVSRTTTAEAQNTAKIVQANTWGYDLVKMTTHSPTCGICAMYQGRVYATTKEAANGKYRLKDGTVLRFPYLFDTAFASGYNTIHPNCRHRISAYPIKAYTGEEAKEIARISNAPFEDTRSDEERKKYSAMQAKNRQCLANRRQYEKIKAVLPDQAPKSYAGFVHIKQSNSENYQNLMKDYRRVNRVINVQNTMAEQVKLLSEEEQKVLTEYSGALATRLNSAISTGKLTPELKAKADLLHQALSKGTMPDTVTLYRDTCISFMKLGLSKTSSIDELEKRIGRVHTNEIFTSTSFSTLDLQGRDTRMYITVQKGYKGCQYIKSVVHSQYRNQEEVLFDAPLTYQISNVKIDENGKILLFVEVLKKYGT